jgi:FkbM family methyltransferase
MSNRIRDQSGLNALFMRSSSRRRLATVEAEAAALRVTLRAHGDTVKAQATALAACEAEVAAREAVVADRERALAACEAEVAAREALLGEQAAAIADLQSTIRGYEDVIRDREATIRTRELTVVVTEATVEARETVIREYEQALRIVGARAPPVVEAPAGSTAQENHSVETAMTRPSATACTPAADAARHPEVCRFEDRRSWLEGLDAELRSMEMSAAGVDRALEEWREIAARHAGQGLRGGRTLIEPYLVERRIHDRPGYLIMAIKESQDWYENDHDCEVPELLRLRMIRQGDTVFDCGANQGLNAVSYARAVGPGGRVIAFDPFPLHIDIARFNARLNNLRNIDFVRVGLSHKAEQLNVSMDEQCVATTDRSAAAKSISLLPLDAFASLRPSFVKLDIEGAEVDALEGAAEIIAMEPAIYIEVHPQLLPQFGRAPSDVFKHVKLSRYACYIDHPGVPRMSRYEGEFEMTQGCALYCIPRSRNTEVRRLRAS